MAQGDDVYTPTPDRFSTLLNKASQGEKLTEREVKQIQKFVKLKGGADINVDGRLGPNTRKAVQNFIPEFKNQMQQEAEQGAQQFRPDTGWGFGEDVQNILQQKAYENRLQQEQDQQARQQFVESQAQAQRTGRDIGNIARGALDTYKIAESLRQIQKGEEDLARLQGQMPQAPMPQENELLQQRLYEQGIRKEQGYAPATRADLYEQGRLNYADTLDAARATSAGQAGTYGTMAQQASINRRQHMRDVTAQEAQQRGQQTRMYDQLMRSQLQEDQERQQAEQKEFYGKELPYYQDRTKAAQTEASTGRENLYNTLGQMPRTLYNLGVQYGRPDQQGQQQGQNTQQGGTASTQGVDPRQNIEDAFRSQNLFNNQNQESPGAVMGPGIGQGLDSGFEEAIGNFYRQDQKIRDKYGYRVPDQ